MTLLAEPLQEARDEISRIKFDKVKVSDAIWRALDLLKAGRLRESE